MLPLSPAVPPPAALHEEEGAETKVPPRGDPEKNIHRTSREECINQIAKGLVSSCCLVSLKSEEFLKKFNIFELYG